MTQNRRRKAATITVYNSTDGPLPYDAEGRIVPARESLEVPATVLVTDDEGKVTDTPQAVDVDPIAGHVAGGRFIITSDLETDDGDAVDAAPTQPEE